MCLLRGINIRYAGVINKEVGVGLVPTRINMYTARTMNPFIQFIINHWALWLALVVVIALLVFEEKKGSVKGVKKITPQAAINLMNHENAQVVDVRAEANFKAGHLVGAINIPLADLEKNIKKLTKYKSKPVILVCNAGQSSLKAGLLLIKQGITTVYSLTGGITGWQKAGLPLSKD